MKNFLWQFYFALRVFAKNYAERKTPKKLFSTFSFWCLTWETREHILGMSWNEITAIHNGNIIYHMVTVLNSTGTQCKNNNNTFIWLPKHKDIKYDKIAYALLSTGIKEKLISL